MKKIILFLCLCSATAYTHAQGISYGVKAGLNLSTVVGKNVNVNADFKQGFHAGAYFKADFILIALQPELLFSQKGYTSSADNMDINARYNYLDIPVLLRIKFFPALSADIGPQFSYLISQSTEITPQGAQTSKFTDLDTFNRSELGGVIGLNVQILKVGVNARYTMGFSEVAENSSMYNTAFLFGASFKF